MLKQASQGFGYLALAGLAARNAPAAPQPESILAAKKPHFAPRAQRVLFIQMRGAPSQMDTFDYKPYLLNKDKNRDWRFQFSQHGESGLWISELFPHIAKHADKLCLLRGMHTDFPIHNEATLFLHTGNSVLTRPSMGAWIQYGLGTENDNLPGFVVMNMQHEAGGGQNWGSAFLPAAYQGLSIGRPFHEIGRDDVRHLANARLSPALQRQQLAFARAANERLAMQDPTNRQIDGLIESYERGFRMQAALPELLDVSDESESTLDMYGVTNREKRKAMGRDALMHVNGTQCLVARRLLEAGVRFVEINDQWWDGHNNHRDCLEGRAWATDQPIAALLTDLDRRGLLDDTLVLWGGEFGRTVGNAKKDGSDHNAGGFTMWMAGGGVKGGFSYGGTDETGENAVEGRMHIHDLHATILHILGLDHKALTYRYAGRDFRLTDVYGRVAQNILA
ncbi:hypothetical protein Pan189_04150 [Stratiformator vulcanicus]|uniref:Sulfatase n=2 Tax=Stratiformator vulcanicus TaxID=2527980 RepID=A0A517QWW5_9PLAN|nr:hypothetical protein Pan189_04150 [Stratiformator vulcanicus]